MEANDAFFALTGYSREEMSTLFDNHFSQLVVDDLTEIINTITQVTIRENKTIDYTYRIRRKDGAIIFIHDIATYDPTHDVFHVVIMDITNCEIAST